MAISKTEKDTSPNHDLVKYSIGVLGIHAKFSRIHPTVDRTSPRLIVIEECYYTYTFPRAVRIFPYLDFGNVTKLMDYFQRVLDFSNRRFTMHRRFGQGRNVSLFFGWLSVQASAIISRVGLAYAMGSLGLGFSWVKSAIMAFLTIKHRKVVHRKWMVRSYIITFAFVTFRFVEHLLMTLEARSPTEVLVLMSRTSWALPLFISKLDMQGKTIKKALQCKI